MQNGYRLPCPPNCKRDVYDVMLACWDASPKQRPSCQRSALFFRVKSNPYTVSTTSSTNPYAQDWSSSVGSQFNTPQEVDDAYVSLIGSGGVLIKPTTELTHFEEEADDGTARLPEPGESSADSLTPNVAQPEVRLPGACDDGYLFGFEANESNRSVVASGDNYLMTLPA